MCCGILLMLFSPLAAQAGSSVHVGASASTGKLMSVVPSQTLVSRSKQNTVSIKLYNSCFATNLRSVSNPLAPSSIITANLSLQVGAATFGLKVNYPALIATSAPFPGGTISNNLLSNLDPTNFSVTDGSGKVISTARAGVYAN